MGVASRLNTCMVCAYGNGQYVVVAIPDYASTDSVNWVFASPVSSRIRDDGAYVTLEMPRGWRREFVRGPRMPNSLEEQGTFHSTTEQTGRWRAGTVPATSMNQAPSDMTYANGLFSSHRLWLGTLFFEQRRSWMSPTWHRVHR